MTVALALTLISTMAMAEDRDRRVVPSRPLPAKVDSIIAAADAAQLRQDAQQKAWDRKVKALTGTVCTGC
jgi:hypothetical protein